MIEQVQAELAVAGAIASLAWYTLMGAVIALITICSRRAIILSRRSRLPL